MGKRLFLLLFAGIMGLVSSPVVLTAADYVSLKGMNNAGVTETVPLPEPEPEPEPEIIYETPVIVKPQIVNYTVTTYINSRAEYEATHDKLSYADIYKFRQMIYAHNTPMLLGNLPNRHQGEIITITEGGVAQRYVVAAEPQMIPVSDLVGKMNMIANGNGHSLAMMTCEGDGSVYRWVVYLDPAS